MLLVLSLIRYRKNWKKNSHNLVRLHNVQLFFVSNHDELVKSQNLAQRRKAYKVNLLILKNIFLAFSESLRENILFCGTMNHDELVKSKFKAFPAEAG